MDVTTVADQVSLIRHHESALRNMRRNQGRTRATTGAIDRRVASQVKAELALLECGQRELVGHLTEEATLAERLRVARLVGQKRPELESRLRSTRLAIRLILKSCGDLPLQMAGVMAS